MVTNSPDVGSHGPAGKGGSVSSCRSANSLEWEFGIDPGHSILESDTGYTTESMC